MGEIADEVFKFIRVTKGKIKKCLVLDCDNTLWGGIIGEDGLAGIKLGKTYPGSPFYEFQQEILNLHHRGVILALCSKNNEADVWEVFHNHPDMVLKQEHIAAAQINWNDKASNLRQIASDLNIGLDSLVFVDDSEFEVNLVQQNLPEVEVIHLPATKSVHYRDILASYSGFDTLTLTEEDKKRGAMYRAEVTRNKLRQEVTDLASYYQSLEMVAEINFADTFTIPRIAQLTQKTNQFNLTTRRYTEADVTAMVESPSVDIISLRLGDSFGDLGLVGVCILKYDQTWAEIDTFLLSCRALGRMAEDLFLGHVLELVKVREFHLVKGTYLSTRKNAQVKDFYVKQGFTTIAETPERIMFEYDLSKYTGQFQASSKK
ncbi:MAG: HAD family hydrolase [Chloroflexi bacterium]|nr:HAD family hydrolase [Chloroflexota bacterium]